MGLPVAISKLFELMKSLRIFCSISSQSTLMLMSHFKDARLNPIVLRPAKTNLGFDQSECNLTSLGAIGLNELLTTNIFNQGYPKNCIFEGNTQVAMVETFAINLSCKTKVFSTKGF